MTGEFSQFEENSVHLSNSVFSLAVGLARVQVNLEIDPVLHGWAKALRLINYLLALPKIAEHKTYLVSAQNCQICEVGESRLDPTVHEEEVEKAGFRYETRVIKKTMKPDMIQEFEEINGILYYQGRISQKNQLRTRDLDGCKCIDFARVNMSSPTGIADPNFS